MATEEEERRRRREEQAALTGLTPEYIDMLERQLSRQRGEETPEGAGADYYTPPLTKYAPLSGDSRSERTGLMRPVGNILDRLVRPGWQASMNRQQRDLTGQRQAYAEQRPTQAAQQSALLTDSQLEALKQKVSDPNATPEERAAATKYLSSYVQALSTRAGGSTGGPDWSQLAGGGGEAGRDAGGSARPRRSGDPSGRGDPPLTSVLPGNLTLSQARDSAEGAIASRQATIDELDKELESLDVEGARKPGRYDWLTETHESGDVFDLDWIAKRKQEIPTEKAALQAEIEELKEHRRPAAGSGTATTAPRP
tara:strand:- start:42 stop:974 length:933 start_codon:yes stop_codon:yes gene_type:complete